MNLDFTVAMTQNFCSLANLHQVWPKTVKGRPRFARHWLRVLGKQRPEVVQAISTISRSAAWTEVANEQSSDSSSSSSSSESDSDSDSGAECSDSDGIPLRKRRLSLKLEELDSRAVHSGEICASKMRRSPSSAH